MSGKIFFLLSGLLIVFASYGQNNYFLEFHSREKGISIEKAKTDTADISRKISEYLIGLHDEGYITASFDSANFKKDTCCLYFTGGNQYSWISLKTSGSDADLLRAAGYTQRQFSGKPFKYKKLAALEENLINISENKGFPFASVFLDSIVVSDNSVKAGLIYNQGPAVTFDTIEVIGSSRIKHRFIQRYLTIYTDDPYNHKKVKNISRIISRLSYLELNNHPSVIFRDNKARVIVDVKDKKANYIDGVVGFLPNSDKSGKLLLNGEANLHLNNLFQSGKSFKGAWKKFSNSGQFLDLAYQHPVFLGSPFDMGLEFNLLKQDSSFINLNRGVKLGQAIGNSGKLNLLVNYKSSRKLNNPVKGEEISDFNYYQYGLEYFYENLDNIYLPRKGFYLKSAATGGSKNLKNTIGSTAEFKGLKKSAQVQGNLYIQKFFAVRSLATILTQLNAGTVLNNKNLIFVSDLYQLGGFNNLRGFSEREFYARDYAIGTIELRIFMDKSSYFTTIIDQAYMFNPLNKNRKVNFATGMGAGFSFAAGPGIFSFIYSLGRSSTQEIRFNLSKIHFGFTSRF